MNYQIYINVKLCKLTLAGNCTCLNLLIPRIFNLVILISVPRDIVAELYTGALTGNRLGK